MNQEPNSRRAARADAREGISPLQGGEDVNEGPAQTGSIVDAATRSAITTVLRYIAAAHNAPPVAGEKGVTRRPCRYCPDPLCPEDCPECGSPIHDLDAVPAQQRASRAEAALARIQALADEYPAGIDTALIHEALDTQAALPARCSCTGTNAGLNACTRCPTPWPDIPGANRIRHDDEPRVQLPAAPAPAVTEQAKAIRILYERWVKAGPPPLGTSMSRWWDARLVELHHAIHPPTPAATEATERPHCPCNGGHFPGADNCRWCKCHRTPVPAATDTPGQ